MDLLTWASLASLAKAVEWFLNAEGEGVGRIGAAIASGILGNRSDGLVCGVLGSARDYFSRLRTTDPGVNHDLEWAAQKAYLVATQELVRQALIRLEVTPAWQIWRPAVDQIRRGIKQDLANEGRTLAERIPDVELWLLEESKQPAERMQRLREAMETKLRADIRNRWTAGEVPDVIDDLLRTGWRIDTAQITNVDRDWHGLIAIAFMEELKRSPRLAAIFQSKLLVEMANREPVLQPVASFPQFQLELDKLWLPLQEIEDSLGVLHSKVDAIAGDVGEVKADVRNLSKLIEQLRDDLNSRHAADRARDSKVANEQQAKLLAQLDQSEKLHRLAVRNLQSTTEQLQIARAEIAKVVAERKQLVERIEQGNRDFATEMAAYRREIFGLTATQNPQLLAALQQYADGDRLGADPVIEEILRAENMAIDAAAMAAANREKAAKLRRLATLRLEMKDRGEKTTADLVAIWQEVLDLDPRDHWGWVELRRLYQEAGRLDKARYAAEQALGEAADDRARSVSLNELGDVLVAAGDLAGARGRYAEALAVRTKLAKDNPASAEAQRDLGVSYTKLGDVALEGGNHAHAADFYRKSLLIMEPLVLRDKSNAAADRSIMAIYLRMGKATGERTWLEKALQVLEKLEEERRIFPADRETLEALRKTLKGQE